MEGNLIYALAFMGGLSLYLVIATAVGRAIYHLTSNLTEDGRTFFSVFGGALFPIVVPILIVILWTAALVNIPFASSTKKETTESSPKLKRNEEENVKTKFKVGDLVTGIKGNPGNHEILYPGCVCRVLEVDPDDEDMNVILVDHIDKEAHKEDIGITYVVPWENFTLIKQKKSIKEVAKKKKKR